MKYQTFNLPKLGKPLRASITIAPANAKAVRDAKPWYHLNFLFFFDNGIKLIEVTGDPRDNEKVQYWTTENGTPATGYIGVEESYSSLLEEYEIRKSGFHLLFAILVA